MLGYRPYATHNKTNFFAICIFVTLRRKPGILNTRFFIFYNTKEKPDLKINMT
jgi:hypothetical protein